MARPVTISDEQVLEAARIVFARDGLQATTREIARQAGVSEGSLFKRFPTKETLFAAAVKIPPVPAWVQEMDRRLGQGDLRANLIQIARGMIRLLQEWLPLVMLTWGSKSESASGDTKEEPPDIRDRRRLTDYLTREMALGRLRPCNTEAVARMLFGACVNFVMDRLTQSRPLPPEEVDVFVEGLINALWEGISPETEEGFVEEHRERSLWKGVKR
jgi:AcrR family transcriptional regulator